MHTYCPTATAIVDADITSNETFYWRLRHLRHGVYMESQAISSDYRKDGIGDAARTAFTHIVFDLASLQFVRFPGTVEVTTSSGERLGSAPVVADDVREACVAALDDAASHTRVRRGNRLLRPAFYNPHTAEVAVGPVRRAQTFRFESPPVLADSGTPATHEEDHITLPTGMTALGVPPTSPRDLSRRLASVRTAV